MLQLWGVSLRILHGLSFPLGKHVFMHHPTLSLFRSRGHPPGGLQRRTPNRNCLYSLTAKSSKKGQSSLNRSSSRADWLQDSYRLSKCQQNAEWGALSRGACTAIGQPRISLSTEVSPQSTLPWDSKIPKIFNYISFLYLNLHTIWLPAVVLVAEGDGSNGSGFGYLRDWCHLRSSAYLWFTPYSKS